MVNAKSNSIDERAKSGLSALFIMFCIWSFVLLARPQDVFPALVALRPALTTSLLMMAFFIFRFGELQSPPFFNERQLKYYTALVFTMILGIPFSLYPKLSFMVVFTEYIIVVLFVFIFYKIVDSIGKLSIVLLLGCLGNGLYLVFALATRDVGSGRLSFSDMFDPNDLAYFALAFLPLNLCFISRNNSIWIRLTCLGLFGIGSLVIFLSGSRGGMIAFAVVIAMLLFIKSTVIKLPLKIAFICMCIVFAFNANINMDRYLTIFEIENDYNITSETGRLAVWSFGIRALVANPITGVGVNCFGEAIGRDREARGAKEIRWQTAHNSLILIGTETGVVGLILFLLISLNVLRIFVGIKKRTIHKQLIKIGEIGLVGFTGLFISGMFLSQAYSFYWAFYIALSAVLNQLIVKEEAIA